MKIPRLAGTTIVILEVIIALDFYQPGHQPVLEHHQGFSTSFLRCVYLFSNNGTSVEMFVYEMALPSGHWTVNRVNTILITEPPEHFYQVELAFTLHEIFQSIDKISSEAERPLRLLVLLYREIF